MTGADGVVMTGADGVVMTGADGVVMTDADGFNLTGVQGVVMTGADGFTYTGPEGVVMTGADQAGLQGFDPELAMLLSNLPDTSVINVAVIYHSVPAQADFDFLRSQGVIGGTVFHSLPIAVIDATKQQIAAISTQPNVRSIYSNKTIGFLTHQTRVLTGQSKAVVDPVLTSHNGGTPLSGHGVTVAVLDTGIDATHPDLPFGTQVAQNVIVADFQGTSAGFLYPTTTSGVANTDLVMGHGTLVAGIVAGTGAASANYYGGMAPGARVLGISAGTASLFFVLSGFDYILSHQSAQNIRVVNCSFGINGVFDAHDPINVATKILHDAGITVVFSAGNNGAAPNSLNPYSVAPWVIGTGSANKAGKLSTFSSRGAPAYGAFHPTLVAPGENVVSARATGVNFVAATGLATGLASTTNDLTNIPAQYLARYTMSSGTSFAAPHVAGTIALMLEANPSLTPDQVKTILQETASPMLGYSTYEVGAGYLNTYAAAQKAAFGTPYGAFRGQLASSNFGTSHDPVVSFNGQAAPLSTSVVNFQIPAGTLFATLEVGWTTWSIFNPLSITISNGAGPIASVPPTLLAGQGFRKLGISLTDPVPGAWSISVSNASLPLTGSVQKFDGAIETFHANYSGVSDIAGLASADQAAIQAALRTGTVPAAGNGFGISQPCSRLDLARALFLGAGMQAPQYLPYSPTFVDVAADFNQVFVESVVNSPLGNLMGATGPYFNPQAPADRLTSAIGAVRALGLDQTAQSTTANPGIADWNSIPAAYRGYAALAVTRNLMKLDSASNFRPADSITRSELAATAVALQQASR
jgi:serine protease AprX